MTEYQLYPHVDIPYVSTREFHANRGRAPHLEQPVHRPRLEKSLEMILEASRDYQDRNGGAYANLSDLGCGDGGLLQLLSDHREVLGWGYDFSPGAALGWEERGVRAYLLDVFGEDKDVVRFGDITVVTEVLEHLADPHEVVRWIRENSLYLVASSPHNETNILHDECHAWAWDKEGYRQLLENGGWTIIRYETVGTFQVVLAESTS